jgi:ClpP class serine protease
MAGLFDVLWLFFIIISLQPVIRKRLLEVSRQRLIAKIERKRNSRVILMVHRQETMGFLGFPVLRYIDIQDSEEIIRVINMTDSEVPIDLVLHTPGGLVIASLQIARAIKKHKGKVTVCVPHFAMSGGTLIALAADEIIMSPHAVLGPVDPQLGEYPAASLVKVVEEKPIDKIEDKTLVLADIAKKAMNHLKEGIKELLQDRYSPDKIEELSHILSQGTWTHDYPITFEKAKELGLHVSSDMPSEFLELMSLYPQPVRRQSTVEYIPLPRGREVHK